MAAERKHAAEHGAKDKLVAELVKRSEFEVPEALVERQIGRSSGARVARLGGAGHESGRHQENGFERLPRGQREQALQDRKASLLLDKIAEEEKSKSAMRKSMGRSIRSPNSQNRRRKQSGLV